MDFEAKIHEALFSIPTVAEYLETTPRTIYNWIKYGAPRMAHRALAARAGTLEHWSGYRFIDDRVIRPDGRVFTRRDLDWFELRYEREAPKEMAALAPPESENSLRFFASIQLKNTFYKDRRRGE